jgi:alkyldihydroxyacetonephosphate synthase
MVRRRSWWGWGYEDQALDDAACRALGERVRQFLPVDNDVRPVPEPSTMDRPRATPPAPVAAFCRDDPLTRAGHAHGKAFRDVVRNLRGELANPPDLVAYPRSEADITAVLDWAAQASLPVVPYGGGTSVVGGVEYRGEGPWLSLDLGALSGVVEVDEVSRAARILAGTLGPAVEDGLRGYGLTLRHFPQSFEFSSFGGWLATRAAGHFATGALRLDSAVESLRVVTPTGVSESSRVPGTGAGPDPHGLWLGSEGALGVIVEAWVRVLPRPVHRARAALAFVEYDDAVAAVRAIAQSGLTPSNCRLLDPLEGMLSAGVDDGTSRLLLGFESADQPVDAALARTVEIGRDHGGTPAGESTVDEWRGAFLAAPYRRDALARLGVVVETFETACTWDRFPALHAAVMTAAVDRAAIVTCRFTHVYPDGPAPYFTAYALGGRGDQVVVWDALKAAVSDALVRHGGTITHHHAVGRDHRPWYDRERTGPFAAALAAAKRTLDPAGILNPGVLVDLA